MSNAQTKPKQENNSNYLTPILFVVDAQTKQKKATQNFLQQKLGWEEIESSALLSWLNEKKETIKIETVRNLIGELAYASHLGKKRAFILLSADQLSSPAQHAFLKSLEEPPTDTQLILVTSQPEKLLPTIHSRCIKHHQIDHSEKDSTKNQNKTIPPTLVKLFTNPQTVDYQTLIKLAQDYRDRDQAIELLEQVLFNFKNGVGRDKFVKKNSLKRSNQVQRQLVTSLQQLKANLNVRLTLENCFFQLKN